MGSRVSVLFVCLGNICRSPTAHGVFLARLARAGLTAQIDVDSAGTAAWHTGCAPDPRASAEAASRGYDLSELRARQAGVEDFDRFDYILAMDSENLAALEALRPPGHAGHLGLLLEFAPDQALTEVPDPYYQGDEGFTQVLSLIETACEGLLQKVCGDAGIAYDPTH